MNDLELRGLIGSHPLGALAAFGLLRCCDSLADVRDARLSWRRRGDWIAVLWTSSACDRETLAKRLSERQLHRGAAPFLTVAGQDDIKMQPPKFAAALRAVGDAATPVDRETADFLASYGSEVAIAPSTGDVKPTAFHMTSGQQHFLKSARDLSVSLDASVLTPRRKWADVAGAAACESQRAFDEALFGPWQYADSAHCMGWDPAAEALYALNAIAPSAAGPASVRAAVWLAFEALPLFPCAPLGNGRLLTRGFDARLEALCWPVWTRPISLDAVRSLLALAALTEGPAGLVELRARGVAEAYCSRRHVDANGRGTLRHAHPVAAR